MTKLTCTRSSPRRRRQMLPIFHQKINRTAVGCNFVSLLRPFCFNIFLIGGFCGKSDLRNWRGKENRLAPRRRKRTVSWERERLVKCIIIELVLRANLPNFRENAKKNEKGKKEEAITRSSCRNLGLKAPPKKIEGANTRSDASKFVPWVFFFLFLRAADSNIRARERKMEKKRFVKHVWIAIKDAILLHYRSISEFTWAYGMKMASEVRSALAEHLAFLPQKVCHFGFPSMMARKYISLHST